LHTPGLNHPPGHTRWGQIPTTRSTTTIHNYLNSQPCWSAQNSQSPVAPSQPPRLKTASQSYLSRPCGPWLPFKRVSSASIPSCHFGYLAFSALNPPCLQLCPSEHSSGPQTPDHLGRTMDQYDSHLHLPHPLPPVRPFFRAFDPQLMCDGVGARHT
jgi:hypothetical protein